MNSWHLGSGKLVVDRPSSHVNSHPEVLGILPEALALIQDKGRDFIETQVDLGRTVGETVCVKTTTNDEVVYAQREGRKELTRFTKNRSPEPCSSVVIVLKWDSEQEAYVMITAYIGEHSLEPWDSRATDADREYWNNHALIWESFPVVSGTETKNCPW